MAGVSTTITPEARALLDTIAGPESKGDYNVMYGGGLFNDFADHPRQAVTITSGPNKGKTSSAAGAYQFLGSTWDDIASRYDINDFSPASQDTAAWVLAQEEYKRDTGRSLQGDLAAGDISRIPASLRNQWTSMPGGIEQGINGNAFQKAFFQNMGLNINSVPALGDISAATAGPGANLPGNVRVPGLAAAPQQVSAGNTDYMNALIARNMAGNISSPDVPMPRARPTSTPASPQSGGMDGIGTMPRFTQLFSRDPSRWTGDNAGGAQLPAIAPPSSGSVPGLGLGGLFGGIGDAINGGRKAVGDAVQGAIPAIQGAGAKVAAKVNPWDVFKANPGAAIQYVLGMPGRAVGSGLIDPLKQAGGSALRAALGGGQEFTPGTVLGVAGNGGTVVQGVNGRMNSVTQKSDYWKQATGQSGSSGDQRGPYTA